MSTCPYYKQWEDGFYCPFTSHFRRKILAPDGPDDKYFVEFKIIPRTKKHRTTEEEMEGPTSS